MATATKVWGGHRPRDGFAGHLSSKELGSVQAVFPGWARTLDLFDITATCCQDGTVYTVESLQMAIMSNKLYY